MIQQYLSIISSFFFSHLILFAIIGLIAFLFISKASYFLIRFGGLLLFLISVLYYLKMI